MKSLLSQLLFEPVAPPVQQGRKIRFDVDELDIHCVTGTMDMRIESLMRQRGYPMTAREIATGIGSNPSQVNKGLSSMMARSQVEVVDLPGSVNEYILAAKA